MVWSKRPKPGGKGLRCKVIMAAGGECGRPARRYSCEKRGYDCGFIEYCKGHVTMQEKRGFTMRIVDSIRKTY
jgi:hypothetical protein